MATKRKKKKRAAADQSKASETRRRERRVHHLYFVRRLKPPEIYDVLVIECETCGLVQGIHELELAKCRTFKPAITANRASGLRMIQAIVATARENAKPEQILRLRRPVETEKYRRSLEHILQRRLEIADDDTIVERQKVSPSGDVVTIEEQRYDTTDVLRALRDAEATIVKLATLEGAETVAVNEPEGAGAGEEQEKKPFTFNFPNVKGTPNDLNDMLAMNLERGKVN